MAVNKVVFGDRTVVDLTGDSVTADTMLEGVTAHDKSGAQITGTAVIPTVNNGKLTIQKNGTTVATFTANQSSAATANITVPVKVSELTNDSNFVADKPTFTEASSRANIASGETFATILGKIKKFFTDLKTVAFTGSYNDLSDKPTIPTVNNATLTIQKNGTTVKTFTANASSNVTANITVPTKVSELTNDSGYVTTDTNNAVTQTATTTNADYEVLFSQTADNTTRTEGARKNSNLKFNPNTGNLQATQLNGVTIGSSPKFTDNDTKNTAGSTDSSSKLFLIGATSQAANPQTYSHDTAYVGTDGCLYSGGTKVLTAHQDISGKVNKSGDTMTGDLIFNKTEATDLTQVKMKCGANDYGRIAAGATASNAGYLEIATADDGTEPIYVRQYSGSFATKGNEATLLDGSGNTSFPKKLSAKIFQELITGSGTAAQDKGEGVSPRYFPAKWTFNTGLTPANGDTITIKIPVAGHDYGVFLSINNGTNYYPVARNNTARLTTHYANGCIIQLVFESAGSVNDVFPLVGGDARTNVSGGRWTVTNFYDSGNTNNAVTQTASTGNADYEVLFSVTADNTTRTEGARKNSNLKFNPSTGNLQATQLNGVTIGSSPKFTDTDTKNTAGSTNTSSKIFLIGATSQAANPQTYSQDTAYVGTDGCLYSGGTKVLTAHQSITGKVDKKTTLDTYYGTCSTAAATAAKVITVTDGATNFSLRAGITIVVKFANTNTASNPTFNVNSTGAKSVWYNTALITTGSLGYAGTANRPMMFTYDGTQWVFVGWSYDANTTYSAMSTNELIDGTVTTSRVVRADYLKTAIEHLIHLQTYYFVYSTVSTLVGEVFAYNDRIVIVANWSDNSKTVFPTLYGTAIFLPCNDASERIIYYAAGTMDSIRTYSGKIKKTSNTAAQVSWSILAEKTDIVKNLTF